MIVNDKIYGEQEIKEPVLVELINSKALQRLKGISQQGLPQEYYHRPIFSRYEHSLGVLMLLRKLDAGLEEQVAGLLHDISHTAFSHVIDWVIGDPTKEDHQDLSHLELLRKSDAGGILEKYGVDSHSIANLESFRLLESEIPNICVDRFDYAIREFADFDRKEKIPGIVGSLVNEECGLVFDSKDNAEEFARGYCDCQVIHWAGSEAKMRYVILADLLKYALDHKIIFMADFAKTDAEVVSLMLNSSIPKIVNTFELLRKPLRITTSENGEGFFVAKKLRYVDPLVQEDGRLRRLSEISEDYKQILEQQKKDNASRKIKVDGWPIK